jgi:hypothetical protein
MGVDKVIVPQAKLPPEPKKAPCVIEFAPWTIHKQDVNLDSRRP